jgi:large repetitive protein
MPIPQDVSQPVFLVLLGIVSADQRSNQPPDPAPPLAIFGAAAKAVEPTHFYAFTPTVRQSGNRKLEFTIENKPAWASFGLKRGTLYGKPEASHTGTYSNIIITVSDGESKVQLAPFTIQVGPQPTTMAAKNTP